MKRFSILIMSLLLLISNFSGAMSMHFCHGEPHQLKVEILEVQNNFIKELACCCHNQQVNSCCYNQSYDEIFSSSIVKFDDESSFDFQDIQFKTTTNFSFIQAGQKPLKSIYFYAKQANSPPLYKLYSKYILYA